MKINLTKQQIRALDASAQFVLCDEWPWDDIRKPTLERAVAALREELSPTQVEDDLATAAALLRDANPANRQWAEKRDAFLESIGEFKEPPE